MYTVLPSQRDYFECIVNICRNIFSHCGSTDTLVAKRSNILTDFKSLISIFERAEAGFDQLHQISKDQKLFLTLSKNDPC